MASDLPAAARNHYGVTIATDGHDGRSRRYAVQGTDLVVFGEGLDDVADGQRVFVTIPEFGGHGATADFAAIALRVPPADVAEESLQRLLEHVSLGLSLEDAEAALARERTTRRIIALRPV